MKAAIFVAAAAVFGSAAAAGVPRAGMFFFRRLSGKEHHAAHAPPHKRTHRPTTRTRAHAHTHDRTHMCARTRSLARLCTRTPSCCTPRNAYIHLHAACAWHTHTHVHAHSLPLPTRGPTNPTPPFHADILRAENLPGRFEGCSAGRFPTDKPYCWDYTKDPKVVTACVKVLGLVKCVTVTGMLCESCLCLLTYLVRAPPQHRQRDFAFPTVHLRVRPSLHRTSALCARANQASAHTVTRLEKNTLPTHMQAARPASASSAATRPTSPR